MLFKNEKFISVLLFTSLLQLCAQESTTSEGSIKEEFETFMKNEGEAFFASSKAYYNSSRLSQRELAIMKRIEGIKDEHLKTFLTTKITDFFKNFLNSPEEHVSIMNLLKNIVTGSFSKHEDEIYSVIGKSEENIQEITKFIKTYTFQSNDDKTKAIALLSNVQRVHDDMSVEAIALLSFGSFNIPMGKKYKSIYSFVEKICKANNLITPKIFINSGAIEAGFSEVYGKPIILLSPDVFKNSDENNIKGVIAHELGHYYYGDNDRCMKFSGYDKGSAPFWREYRADLFASQYGFGSNLSKYMQNQQTSWTDKLFSFFENPKHPSGFNSPNHPSDAYRINYLKNMPANQIIKTIDNKTYRLTYEPYFKKTKETDTLGLKLKPKLTEVTNPSVPGKIVNTTAQPLKQPSARAAQVVGKALQAAKRLPK